MPAPQPGPAAHRPGRWPTTSPTPAPTTARLVHHLGPRGRPSRPSPLGPAARRHRRWSAWLIAVTVIRRTQARRMAEGARLVQVLAPPDVDPQGAATLWTNLVALLRPAWRRLARRPAPPRLRAHRHRRRAHHRPLGARARSRRAWSSGRSRPPGPGRAPRPSRPPRRSSATGSPPAARCAWPCPSTTRCAPSTRSTRSARSSAPWPASTKAESACVQILARPVTGRRLTRLHKAAAARRAGRPATRTGPPRRPGHPRTGRPAADDRPVAGADVADILDKAAQPCWAIAVRYAVATTATDRQAAGPAAGPGPRRGLGLRPLRRTEPPRPPPAPPPRPGPRRPPARPGRPGLGRRAGRPGPSAHRRRPCPAWPEPGPTPSPRRPPSPDPLPSQAGSADSTRPSCSATPKPAGAAPSPWPSPTPATTSTSWGPPGRASRRCSPTWSSATSTPAAAWWSSTPRAT